MTKKDEKPAAEVKAFESFEIKDEATGDVEAIIATLGVVDRDGDVIQKDAIKSGSKVKMSAYGHDIVGFMAAGAIPVGKGLVTVENDKAVFRGKVFTSTQRGRETIEVLKEFGKDQEWSFGYRVRGSEVPDEDWRKKGAQRILTKLDVFEVSPVLIGAGIGTRTVAAKQASAEAAEQLDPLPPDPAAEAARLAEEKRVADEAAETARLAEEKRVADEVEVKRLADEAEAKRLADEAETKRVADEAAAETQRQEIAAEVKRLAEIEAKRLYDEAEAKRLGDAAAAAKTAEEAAEVKRLAVEAEAKRLADDAELRREAGDAAVRRRAEEAEVKRLADEATARLLTREEEQVAAQAGAEFARFSDIEARVQSQADAEETKRLGDQVAAEFDRFQKTARFLGAA